MTGVMNSSESPYSDPDILLDGDITIDDDEDEDEDDVEIQNFSDDDF